MESINGDTKVGTKLRYIIGFAVTLLLLGGSHFVRSQAAQNAKIDEKVNVTQYNIDQDRMWDLLNNIYRAVK